MGSDFGVKSHQFVTKTETVALSGGFFGGGAQRLPAVFLGGDGKLPHLAAWFFLSVGKCRHAPRPPLRDIMISAIQNHQGDFSI
jgi:hypothetical protein